MEYSLLTDFSNTFTNLFSLLGFSSGSLSAGSSSKSKLDRKCDSKESHCINVFPGHFPRLSNPVEVWFVTFLTSVLLMFMNSLSCFFRFALLGRWQYMIFKIYRKFFDSLSKTQMCYVKGNQSKKSFGQLVHLIFLKEVVTMFNHSICIIRRTCHTIIPV